MAKSVTQETKTKFESLLKVTLNKKRSKSTLNLIENDSKAPHDTGITNDIVEADDDVANKNFILNKFLKDDEVKENDSAEFIKPPIPKPRKKMQQSSSNSNETYSIKSSKILNVIDKNNSSGDSQGTYDIQHVISKEDSDTSDSSNRTYNVHNSSVGDILYGDKLNKALIVDLSRTSSAVRSSKSQKISGHEIEMANFHEEPEKMRSISDILQETEIKSSDSASSTKITFENELKRRKKKKKKENLIQTMEESLYKYEEILNIIVHHTDKLELNSFVIHPVVKVYLVDYETGQYIKKTDSSRGAVFHTENKNVTYIMPVITQNFNLQEKRQFKPEWEESIIINEDFKYITNPETKVILFFELLDFVGFSEAALQSSVYSRGWHRIAWAFLKINAADGTTNTRKKLRLQLYKPGKDKSSCPVYDWWREKRIKYSSTLYITVKAITPPNIVVETFRSKTPLEREKSTSILDEHVENSESTGDIIKNDKEKVKAVLSVLENDTCKLPNSFLTNIDSGDEGCFVLKFSNTGTFLACAVNIKDNYTLVLYTVPEFETYHKLPSHQELIYNISFSKDDLLVATSSSDGTVSIWNLEKWCFLQILPHPSFVYWCEIANDNTIATGCYDKTVRIWASSNNEAKREYFLIDELEGHLGYVTSVCFNTNSTILFSSDSIGQIFLWKRADRVWKHLKTIKLPELNNTLINQIALHRKERKLVVHARDSVIRIVDVKNECILNWLEGALNIKVRTLCCISSCGSYVMCGSDNGIMHVWNVDTGKSAKTYHPYSNIPTTCIPIHTVDMSPKGSLMAFGHFGNSMPIQVYGYDPKKSSNKLRAPSYDRPLKVAVHKTKPKKDKASDSEEDDNEKDVDLKNILEKIDRIIK
ncbi:hypothetical protein Trydic_g1096 [Trypoxylus dichotomus]